MNLSCHIGNLDIALKLRNAPNVVLARQGDIRTAAREPGGFCPACEKMSAGGWEGGRQAP
jgi:hypothetical protein